MKDDLLVLELASGSSVAEASRRTGASARTIWRRLQDPAFRERISQCRRDAFANAAGALQTSAIRAAQALTGLLTDESPAIRLRAAIAVIEQAARIGELADLQSRLAALEAAA